MYIYNTCLISLLVIKIIIRVSSGVMNVGLFFFGNKDAQELLGRLPFQDISDSISLQVYPQEAEGSMNRNTLWSMEYYSENS
jgi:hypothetical protein